MCAVLTLVEVGRAVTQAHLSRATCGGVRDVGVTQRSKHARHRRDGKVERTDSRDESVCQGRGRGGVLAVAMQRSKHAPQRSFRDDAALKACAALSVNAREGGGGRESCGRKERERKSRRGRGGEGEVREERKRVRKE